MESPDQRPFSGAQWTISAAGHEAVIVEVGGGLRTYRHDGVDLVDGYQTDEVCPGCAGQVLAPWPNGSAMAATRSGSGRSSSR